MSYRPANDQKEFDNKIATEISKELNLEKDLDWNETINTYCSPDYDISVSTNYGICCKPEYKELVESAIKKLGHTIQ